MEERHVITCFLEHQGRILLLRRSERVGTYQGKWAGVSGYIEEGATPYEQALRELSEEAGLSPGDVELVQAGDTVEAVDEALGRRWVVHPFRFALADPMRVKLDWEHVEARWVEPDDIGSYETVPKLAEAWLAVKD